MTTEHERYDQSQPRPRTRLATMTHAADWLGVSRQTLHAIVKAGVVQRVPLTSSISRIDLVSLHRKVEFETGLPTDRDVPLAAQTLSHRDVAEHLGVSISTVRAMIREGRIHESVFSKQVRLVNTRALDALVGESDDDK